MKIPKSCSGALRGSDQYITVLQAPGAFDAPLAAAEHAASAAAALPGLRVLGQGPVGAAGGPLLMDPLKLTLDVQSLGLTGGTSSLANIHREATRYALFW